MVLCWLFLRLGQKPVQLVLKKFSANVPLRDTKHEVVEIVDVKAHKAPELAHKDGQG